LRQKDRDLADKNNDLYAGAANSSMSKYSGENSPDEMIADDYPFLDLKAIVLSIEWEITDQVMRNFIDEINRLKQVFHDNKIFLSFLKLQGSIGKYIISKKANAHPDSIKLLHSAYNSLEKIATTPDMDKTDMKVVLSAEVSKFKELKKKIILLKSGISGDAEKNLTRKTDQAAVGEEIKSGKVLPESGFDPLPSDEVLSYLLQEIKKIIKSEFSALRKELKLSRHSR